MTTMSVFFVADNSDLLSCTVVPQQHCSLGKPGDRLSRFLVTDRLQLILVEPDSRKAGWAIVRFVGLLQDMTISGDSADSKVLHVVVEGQPSRLKVSYEGRWQFFGNKKFSRDEQLSVPVVFYPCSPPNKSSPSPCCVRFYLGPESCGEVVDSPPI
uniref:CLEC16A/TT9 C-terminal domain-containing protein n=1 Tax=Caenorhabditis japonica TaxID=281687 RepID=A0A8R1IQW6_CAEJA